MSWPPTSKKPEWMPKEDSDTYCARHQCQKTWMINSGFCPKCEAEISASSAPAEEDNFNFGAEITVPDFKILKCIYCATHELHPMDIDMALHLYKCLNVTPKDQNLRTCTCSATNHKLNIGVGFYQCQSCLNYNLEINSK